MTEERLTEQQRKLLKSMASGAYLTLTRGGAWRLTGDGNKARRVRQNTTAAICAYIFESNLYPNRYYILPTYRSRFAPKEISP